MATGHPPRQTPAQRHHPQRHIARRPHQDALLRCAVRRVAAGLALGALATACGGTEAPSGLGPSAIATTVESTPASVSVAATLSPGSPLDGRWSTGAIPIAQIKATLLHAGVTNDLADQWIVEVGSPTEYTFELEFTGEYFDHYETTPAMARNLGESGTYIYTDGELRLNIVDHGDTYRMAAELSGDQVQLRYLDSTETDTEQDKAKHVRFLIAFYTSAPFVRQP